MMYWYIALVASPWVMLCGIVLYGVKRGWFEYQTFN